jgi:predicted metal-dependent phosphoesterase TrpH
MPIPAPHDRVIDLHAHTTASDGEHSPTELVEKAVKIGLAALAVTDHDTTDGVAEALATGEKLGLEVVPGIELSAEPPHTPTASRSQCHILGLFIDPASAPLLKRLEEVIRNRNLRNARIIERIQKELDWKITLEEVEAAAGGDVVARPHFARVMVDKGYVQSVKEAFDLSLGKGGKAYVDRDRLTAEEAIQLIHSAGGVAVLAHPNNLKMDEQDTEHEIRRLQSLGLDGIEARYNLHTPGENSRYLALADRLNLVTSGGSDFHGLSVKPTVHLGHVEGNRPAPYSLLDALQNVRQNFI